MNNIFRKINNILHNIFKEKSNKVNKTKQKTGKKIAKKEVKIEKNKVNITTRITLSQIIQNGIIPKYTLIQCKTYFNNKQQKQQHRAIIMSGTKIYIIADECKTLGGALKSINSRGGNGWNHWKIKDENNKQITIGEFRDNIESKKNSTSKELKQQNNNNNNNSKNKIQKNKKATLSELIKENHIKPYTELKCKYKGNIYKAIIMSGTKIYIIADECKTLSEAARSIGKKYINGWDLWLLEDNRTMNELRQQTNN